MLFFCRLCDVVVVCCLLLPRFVGCLLCVVRCSLLLAVVCSSLSLAVVVCCGFLPFAARCVLLICLCALFCFVCWLLLVCL